MDIRLCKECGFILGTRPHLREEGGVCLACLNKYRKKYINWKERQKWLTRYLKEHTNTDGKYDVAVGVSGGKDSTSIVSRLINEHEVPPSECFLCICVTSLHHRMLGDDDWMRQGGGDNYSQIDSLGYMIHLWTKFVKFGFQRVSDIACRHVREGLITREQAVQLIKDEDWRCDPLAKKDFCRTIGITEEEFNETIDRFANRDLLVKDANGNWRRKDLI